MSEARTLNAALIGFGAIGREVYSQTARIENVVISQVLVRPGRTADVRTALRGETEAITRADQIDPQIDVVLEVAGHGALASHGVQVIENGIDLCVASVGALADPSLLGQLKTAAQRSGAQVEILPGAIGGIDAIAAAGTAGLSTVDYTGRKPPLAWKGSFAEQVTDLAAVSEAIVIFEGNAREAAQTFPRNANVVATVALAGLGFEKTRVRLVADPAASGNSHQISLTGPLLEAEYSTSGKALASNPRSSALTAHSALRALKNRAGPLSV